MSTGAIPFILNPLVMRMLLNKTGEGGVGRTASAPNSIFSGGASIPTYSVSVRQRPGSGGDHSVVHTGPGAGVAAGVGVPNDLHGITTPTGNKILIDDTFGSDTVMMQHHSGASVLIDADGAIHIVSTGKKGVSINAGRGDVTIHSSGHMILAGDSAITLESKGDMDFNVGGHLAFHVKGDITSYVKGSSEEIVDGTKIVEVVKDFVTTVAGDQSHTSAGNYKIQSSSGASIDAAKEINIRADDLIKVQTQTDHIVIVKGDSTLDVKGTHTTTTLGDIKHQTKGKLDIIAEGDTAVQTKGKLEVVADGNLQTISSGTTTVSSSGTIGVYSGSSININGSTTNIQGGGSPVSVSAGSAEDNKDALKAMYAPAKTIIDSVTSARVAPDFPENAARMSANEFSLYKNEGGTPNPKAEAYAAGNKGGGMNAQPSTAGETTVEPQSQSAVDIPPGITPNGKAEKNPMEPPTSIYNASQKISRSITLGQVLGIRDCPQAQQKQVIENAMNTAWNIFDPLIAKFGSDVHITSWYRNPPRANHPTGGAVDFRCSNRENHAKTAEMAAYIRDNLPYEQLFLEKNDQGGIHCHVKGAQPGAGASGNVMTCKDSACSGKVPGIQLSYAMAALKGQVA
jgi:hypothetical protein